jgi:hypothetical protein
MKTRLSIDVETPEQVHEQLQVLKYLSPACDADRLGWFEWIVEELEAILSGDSSFTIEEMQAEIRHWVMGVENVELIKYGITHRELLVSKGFDPDDPNLDRAYILDGVLDHW